MGKDNEHNPLPQKALKAQRVEVLPLKLDSYRLNKADMYTWSRHPFLFWVKAKLNKTTLKYFESSVKAQNFDFFQFHQMV